MVYIYSGGLNEMGISLITQRNTGKYYSMIIIESIVGLIVAFSNIVVILILFFGRKTLMKNNFYVVLTNLIACTSLKALVELSFIVPYYIIQRDSMQGHVGLFNDTYELLIFNISVLADYGVLFFSVLIAINRFIAIKKSEKKWQSNDTIGGTYRKRTILSCIFVWLLAAIIPAVLFLFQCQYEYERAAAVYLNICYAIKDNSSYRDIFMVILNCLIYLSYVCAGVVLVLYLLMIRSLRIQRRAMSLADARSMLSNTQMQLLRQCFLIFSLYLVSILSVFAMSFLKTPENMRDIIGPFYIAYIENLLNLSIAAVYPMCFLAMSGEMRSVLVSLIAIRGRVVSSNIRVSSNAG